ncbi:LOW QUALITY PROTEIN: 60S acidic ribosomal protein P2-like [Acanthaster planci]|uniref:Large ribosomal subunit protein P2 n=1 Tax=Acanthaster planci TaxID=133434 RepID=A0A8B7YSI0_ACAPL|nr:LOW QUALITY PROTEIN: 60S acidic ribosomal protein P2-like [Acanthaster planci]
MRYVAAYLLAVLGGNESPSANDIKKILETVAVGVEDEPLNRVIEQLSGKNIDDVIAQGQTMLASVPTGGVAAAAGAGGGGEGAGAASEQKEEEAKKEEEEEESDDDMGFGLFD